MFYCRNAYVMQEKMNVFKCVRLILMPFSLSLAIVSPIVSLCAGMMKFINHSILSFLSVCVTSDASEDA